MKVHLKTLGCRLNEAEIERWAGDFQARGHQIVSGEQQPDLVVMNTCAVTHSAARKSRQIIRRIQRNNPQSKLIVSGCYASISPDEITSLGGIDLLLDNQQKDKLVEIASERLHLHTMPVTATEPQQTALFSRGRQRAFVKVQDGCRYRCAFCIVTKARGNESSRSIDEIVDEVDALHRQGVSEAIITGVHLGGYGSDLNTDLMQLIQALLERTEMPRIRMGSLEPWDLPPGFFALFENSRLMPHLHLPLQSGSDSVLRRMMRRCKTEDFRTLVQSARDSHPDLYISSDIIVGFPGETDDEWRQTLDFVADIGFSDLHIFSYSKRNGTKAADMPDQVDERVKKQRSEALHHVAAKMKRQHQQTLIGSTAPILWEEAQGDTEDQPWYFGYTPNYQRVKCRTTPAEDLSNQVLPARITGLDQRDDVLIAELCSPSSTLSS